MVIWHKLPSSNSSYTLSYHVFFAASPHRGLGSESAEETLCKEEFSCDVSGIGSRAVGHICRRRFAFMVGGWMLKVGSFPHLQPLRTWAAWSWRQLGLGSRWDVWDIVIRQWTPPVLLSFSQSSVKLLWAKRGEQAVDHHVSHSTCMFERWRGLNKSSVLKSIN